VDTTTRFLPSTPARGRYDDAGNMTQNGVYGYDAENRLVNLSGTATYTYDADGQRVAKPNVLYWAGSSADALAESNASGTTTSEYVFFGGRRVARIDVATPEAAH
jgi:hypothetical protein